ncbi:MAG TPA: hypothetical protein VJ820_05215 [Propionibacteriaceae bacterium]|nr:hypothetical protein [Propionibacteriaceae bacterium]
MHIYSPAPGVRQLSAVVSSGRLPVPETLISGGSEAEFVYQLSDAWFQERIRHGPDDPY